MSTDFEFCYSERKRFRKLIRLSGELNGVLGDSLTSDFVASVLQNLCLP